MQLSRMQDIGGCRAIVDNIDQVLKVRAAYARSKQEHQFVSEKDYIAAPKSSGYRGIHLIYRYHSDRKPDYNGRLIEIQLRTQLQHAWATAVETVGTFLQQSLKASEGSEKWLRFFVLAGSAFAVAEHTERVPGTPVDDSTLRTELSHLGQELQAKSTLGAYGQALKIAEDTKIANAYYFLLSLIPSQNHLVVYGYRKEEFESATEQYLQVEKTIASLPGAQAVLVAVESLSALKKSYPNYFLDTEVFIGALDKAIEGLARNGRRRNGGKVNTATAPPTSASSD